MYTTIGQVHDYVIRHYEETGKRISFPQALQEIQVSCSTVEFPVSEEIDPYEISSRESFWNYIRKIPIDCSRVLSNRDPQLIEENATIPLGKNLLSYVHLPFIDDRIHTHDHFEINYVYSGSARQIIDREQRRLISGEFCIIAPNMRHNVLVDDIDSLIISIPVRKSTFDSIFGKLLTQNDLLSSFFQNTLYQDRQSRYLLFKTEPGDRSIVDLIHRITIESNSEKKYAAACVDNLVPLLFYTLLRKYSNTILYYGGEKNDPTHSVFALMLTYVQSHYRNVSLSELSELFAYSPEYISRLFKKNMHMSFNQILQNLRMQEAAHLLLSTDLSVSEITEQVGYTSPDYFTRSFRRHFGCAPTQYRK